MDHEIHIALLDKIIHPIPDILQIGRIRRNDVDDAHDLLPPRHGRAMVVPVVAVSIGSGLLVVDPETRDGVADDAAKLAKFL